MLEAGTAQDALALVRTHRADLILCDLIMPGIDGIEFLRRLRAAEIQIPFVMVTGHATLDSAVEALRLGAFDYVSKPARLSVLRALLAKARRMCVSGAETAAGPRLEGVVVHGSGSRQEEITEPLGRGLVRGVEQPHVLRR